MGSCRHCGGRAEVRADTGAGGSDEVSCTGIEVGRTSAGGSSIAVRRGSRNSHRRDGSGRGLARTRRCRRGASLTPRCRGALVVQTARASGQLHPREGYVNFSARGRQDSHRRGRTGEDAQARTRWSCRAGVSTLSLSAGLPSSTRVRRGQPGRGRGLFQWPAHGGTSRNECFRK